MDSPQPSKEQPGGADHSSTPSSSAIWPPLVHTRPIIPDHELLKIVGRGSYGEVWLARNIMGSFRAIKIIYRDAFDDDKPYQREFEGIKKFEPVSRTHPSQIEVLHVGKAEGCFYYVMQLADDVSAVQDGTLEVDVAKYAPKTLKSETASRGPLPVAECIEIGLALTTALTHLHQSGLVHRDIKPSNIIYVNGLPKLADIGLVCGFDATQSFVGTLGFAAPEWPGTPQADIYSLGKVLYEAATGRDRQEFPELPTRLAGTPGQQDALLELNEVLLKACETNPKDRYFSADDMHEDLLLLRSGKSLVRLRTVERRFHRLKQISLVVGLFTILALAAFFLTFQQNQRIRKMGEAVNKLEKENRHRLAELQVSKGTDFMDQQDFGQALAWFSAALPNVQDDPHLDQVHRLRLNSILQSFPKLTHLLLPGEAVARCEFTPDGSRLVSLSGTDTLNIYDVEKGKLEFSLSGNQALSMPTPNEYSAQLVFSGDGDRVVVRRPLAYESTEIFDLKHRRKIQCAPAEHPGSRILDSLDGRTVLLRTDSSSVRLFDIDTGEPISAKMEVDGEILAGRLTPGNGYAGLWFCRRWQDYKGIEFANNYLQVWDIKHGTVTGTNLFAGNGGSDPKQAERFLIRQDGKKAWFVTVGESAPRRHVRSVDVQTGAVDKAASDSLKNPSCVIIGLDDQWIALGGASQDQILKNIETDESLELKGAGNALHCTVSSDGLLLATASEDGTAQVWDRRTGERLLPVLRHSMACNGVALSSDGARIATCSLDGSIRLWDLAPPEEPRLTVRLADEVLDVACSPNARSIAAVTRWWGSTRVWDSHTGRPISRPLTEMGGGSGIAFSSDGSKLLQGPNPGAYVWDTSDYSQPCKWLHEDGVLQSARFSHDGKKIITAFSDNKIHSRPTGLIVETGRG